LRTQWARDLLNQAVLMDRLGSTPYPQALQLPLSVAQAYFETQAFKFGQDSIAAKDRAIVAIGERVDNVVRAVGALHKAIASLRAR